MTTLPNMGIDLPTPGGDSGSWDDKINAAFGLIDTHNHASGAGVAVPTAGININADLSFGGYGATALGRASFSAVAALASGSKTLFVSNADNELYWRTNAGANVKLTNGTSINTTLVGGIVGDYSSVGAAVAYDDANKRYTLKTQTATWARLATGPVRIFEYNTTDSVYVEHAVAAALAASYTVTWPAALPGSTQLVQITSAGIVSYSNTIAENVTLAAGKTITLSGAGVVKHGEYEVSDLVYHHCLNAPSGTYSYANAAVTITAGNLALVKIPVTGVGSRLLRFKFTGAGNVGSTAPTIACERINSDNTRTAIPITLTTLSGAVTSGFEYEYAVTTPTAYLEGRTLALKYTPQGNDASLFSISAFYDRP